jgi:hypothetical protein
MLSSRRWSPVLLIALMAYGCGKGASGERQVDSKQPAGEELASSDPMLQSRYDVYDSIIRYEEESWDDVLVFLSMRPGREPNVLDARAAEALELEGLRASTLEGFHERNAVDVQIQELFSVEWDVVLLSPGELDGIFENEDGDYCGGWGQFHGVFPGSGGLLRLTEVGFSGDGHQALAGMSISCSCECGWKKYYLLSWDAGEEWRVDAVWWAYVI